MIVSPVPRSAGSGRKTGGVWKLPVEIRFPVRSFRIWRRSRLLQFSEAVVKEVNRTFENDNVDIRAIGEEVYEKYGVRFEVR